MYFYSAAVAELERKECVQEVTRGPSKFYLMGSGKPPYTLIAAVEKVFSKNEVSFQLVNQIFSENRSDGL